MTFFTYTVLKMDSELIETTSLWHYSYQLMIDKSKEREKENAELRQTGMPELAGNTLQLVISRVKKENCVLLYDIMHS